MKKLVFFASVAMLSNTAIADTCSVALPYLSKIENAPADVFNIDIFYDTGSPLGYLGIGISAANKYNDLDLNFIRILKQEKAYPSFFANLGLSKLGEEFQSTLRLERSEADHFYFVLVYGTDEITYDPEKKRQICPQRQFFKFQIPPNTFENEHVSEAMPMQRPY